MMLKDRPAATKIKGQRAPAATAEAAERARLAEDTRGEVSWKRWGPYLSERQWGTVREDYSPYGNAWEYLSHDQARSRAYCWGEDGIAGISDDTHRLCLALALWNGKDPILKERLFGLTNAEGNHSEDVKELYYYLDATPTHSYLKYLYKYPQREFPYNWLVEENRRRGKDQPEFELLDTGVFDDDRYFDVFVEYAKAGPEDILMHLVVHNRGPEAATLHLLPQLWFPFSLPIAGRMKRRRFRRYSRAVPGLRRTVVCSLSKRWASSATVSALRPSRRSPAGSFPSLTAASRLKAVRRAVSAVSTPCWPMLMRRYRVPIRYWTR
jgi:hypothetical protein